MNLSPLPIQKFFANNGRPLDGGLLFTYAAGTSTKIATYTDSGGLSSNTNPIVLDFRGECRIWIDPSLTYKFVLAPPGDTDPPTNPIWTVDNISIFGDSGASVIGKLIWPLTAAEIAAGFNDSTIDYVGPQGFLPRYKIVASDPTKATQNTLAMQSLFDPLVEDGPVGQFWFPNNGGGEVYYFNDHVEVRPGVYIDCGGATLNFTKEYDAADDFKGFLMAIRDFEIKNGTISYTMTSAPAGKNLCAFRFGSRTGYAFGQWPAGIYDQTDLIDEGLPPMGNIAVRDMRIDCDNPGYAAIFAFGGLENVLLENCIFDGLDAAYYAMYYEFGYSSQNGAPSQDELWSSSHANNIHIVNCKGRNFDNSGGLSPEGAIFSIVGAYSVIVDGLDGQSCNHVFEFRPGEALFYRPWAYNTPGGVKHCVTLRNITGRDLNSTGISLVGSEAATGYLSPLSLPAEDQTDLMQFDLDGFSIEAPIALSVSGPVSIRNGLLVGTSSTGTLVIGPECVQFSIENVEILDNPAGAGIRANQAGGIFSPQRNKIGSIRGCVIAGNTTNGCEFDFTQNVVLENNRFGHAVVYDGVAETAQTSAVNVGTTGSGIVLRNNYAALSGSGTAYVSTGSGDRRNQLWNNSGTTTYTARMWANQGWVEVQDTSIAAKANVLNTTNKYAGKQIWDETNLRGFRARGATDVSPWDLIGGGGSVTPS